MPFIEVVLFTYREINDIYMNSLTHFANFI